MHSVPTRRRTLCQPSFFRWKCYRLPSIPTGRTPMHPLRLPVRAARSPRRPRAPRPARPPPRVRTPPARLRPLQTRRPALLAPRLQPRLLGDIVPASRWPRRALRWPTWLRCPWTRTRGPAQSPSRCKTCKVWRQDDLSMIENALGWGFLWRGEVIKIEKRFQKKKKR